MDGPRERGEGIHAEGDRVYRRVTDDLRIITGLFDIRMAQVADEDTLRFMRELQTLTRVMTIVHGTIYASGNPAGVGAQHLFEKIVKSVRITRPTSTWIESSIRCGDAVLPAACAVPCAFVLAEIIRNSILRSFEDTDRGRIDVSFAGPDEYGCYTLVAADNGFPEYASPG